jgi:tripartite-type tricarboxylate transporter receptor subunit TctC
VPTLAESGVPGYDATLWLGLVAPALTPPEIIGRLQAETAKLLQDPELRQSFRGAGIEAQAMGPQEFAAFLAAEHAKWGQVVRATGATVN